MGLKFQVEPWKLFVVEAQALWPLHWEEVGQDRERMPLDANLAGFAALDDRRGLHVVTVRTEDGTLAGYHISILGPLLHYRGVIAATGDAFWLHPQCRGPGVAVRLFQMVERTARERGTSILYDATKLSLNQGRMFEFLGYRAISTQYSKWIR